eukprot:scaffold23596_cov91-Skeletonema_dohrnii-CCMP3373.AAC.2
MNKVVLNAMGVWILLHPSLCSAYVEEEQSTCPFSKQSAVKRVSFQEELTRVDIVIWLFVATNAAFDVKHSHNLRHEVCVCVVFQLGYAVRNEPLPSERNARIVKMLILLATLSALVVVVRFISIQACKAGGFLCVIESVTFHDSNNGTITCYSWTKAAAARLGTITRDQLGRWYRRSALNEWQGRLPEPRLGRRRRKKTGVI